MHQTDESGRVTRLRALRLARGWSQAELARRVGASQTTVSAAERGMTARTVLERLADVLGETPGRLLDRVFLGPVS